MNYQNISLQPIDDISRFADSIYAIEENNIREKKKNERNKDEIELLTKEKDMYSISNNIHSNKIIPKLRRVLSKKYNLSLNDYIIIIDKFKLNSENLSRETVLELMTYLNSKTTYNNKISEIYSKENEIQASKIAALDKDEFNKNVMDMEKERELYIQNFLINKNMKIDKPINEIDHDISLKNNMNINLTDNLPSDTVSNINLTDNLPSDTISDTNEILSKFENVNQKISQPIHSESILNSDYEDDIFTKKNFLNNKSNNLEKKEETSLNFKKNEDTIDIDSTNEIDLEFYNNFNNFENDLSIINENNTMIEDNIRNTLINNKTDIKQHILVFNLLKHENKGTFKINIDENIQINNIKEISILDCFLNKNFCEKNYIHKSPGLIFKIHEFEDNVFFNSINLKAFSRVYLEKYTSFYKNLTNDDKSVFKPGINFSLQHLTIELYNINGTIYKEFSYTDNDIFNISLKILHN